MSDDQKVSTAQEHKVDVRNNPALKTLYAVGAAGMAVGALVGFIGLGEANVNPNPTGALLVTTIGWATLSIGFFMLTSAIIVHAINWQIGRSGFRETGRIESAPRREYSMAGNRYPAAKPEKPANNEPTPGGLPT